MGMERAVTSLVTGKHSGGLPWPFGLVLATNMCHLLATALTYQKRVWQKGTGLFHKRTRSFIFLPLYEGCQASWIPWMALQASVWRSALEGAVILPARTPPWGDGESSVCQPWSGGWTRCDNYPFSNDLWAMTANSPRAMTRFLQEQEVPMTAGPVPLCPGPEPLRAGALWSPHGFSSGQRRWRHSGGCQGPTSSGKLVRVYMFGCFPRPSPFLQGWPICPSWFALK